MFNKSFVSILIVTSSFILAIGQTPEAEKEKIEKSAAMLTMAYAGDGGYLGIQTQEVTKENFAKFGLREVRGVAVEKVVENSPAASAGILAGDVIVRFDGEEVTSARKLTRLISEVAPDHQVKLTVLRGGSEQEIAATLGKRQMPKFENGNFTFSTPGPMNKMEVPNLPAIPNGGLLRSYPMPGGEGRSFAWRAGEGRQIGIGVTALSKQLAAHFGVESGVMINNVRENSPAAKAGLKAGDIIVESDGKAVKGDFDLIRAINGKKEGDVSLTIVRDGKRQTISVTPEVSKDSGFFFQTDDDEDLTPPPANPAQVLLTRPMAPMTPMKPVTPMFAPAPMTAPFPGRII